MSSPLCTKSYKGKSCCGYDGPFTGCDGSLEDCRRHGNEARFGGWYSRIHVPDKPAEPKRYLYHIGGCGGKVTDIPWDCYGRKFTCESCRAEQVECKIEFVMTEAERATYDKNGEAIPAEPKVISDVESLHERIRQFSKIGIKTEDAVRNLKASACAIRVKTKEFNESMNKMSEAIKIGVTHDKYGRRLTKRSKTMKIKTTIRVLAMLSFIRCIAEALVLVHPLVVRIPWQWLPWVPTITKPAMCWVMLSSVCFAVVCVCHFAKMTLKAMYRWIF